MRAYTLTHAHAHSLQSSSARASPFCPRCLTWSCSAAWTQHVSWKDRRSQLTHCGPLPTNHLYHTALQGYQRENAGQPFAQTRGLANNVLTCWEIFKTYSQLPCWLRFFFLTYNLFVEKAKLLVLCGTPIKQLCRKWTPPAQITAPILGHLKKTGSKWHCSYIKCYYALYSSVKTLHALVCVEHGKGADTRVHKWRNMENFPHCTLCICAKGYRHEWWSWGKFHNTCLKSRSCLTPGKVQWRS